jgi:hypothetical protein
MKIHIETIPHREQRYDTVGDWWLDEAGDLQIRVSDMSRGSTGRRRMESLVAVHELIEALLCQFRGIADEDVTAFDTAFVPSPENAEPGDDPLAPYREEHFFATTIERLLSTELRVDWLDYENALAADFGCIHFEREVSDGSP